LLHILVLYGQLRDTLPPYMIRVDETTSALPFVWNSFLRPACTWKRGRE